MKFAEQRSLEFTHIEKIVRPKKELKILICPFYNCLKEFKDTGNLKTHIRTHTGERPFVCSYCQTKFITKGHLQSHLVIHTGNKQFKCHHKGCTKKYSRLGRLKQHTRLHVSDFVVLLAFRMVSGPSSARLTTAKSVSATCIALTIT